MKTGFKVADAMTKRPIMVTPDRTIEYCAKVMKSKRVGSLLVELGAKLKGIVTEQDIVRKAVASTLNPKKVAIKKIMEKKIHTITPDADIVDAVSLMSTLNIRHLPVVVDRNIIGFLTIKDILKIEPTLFEIIADKMEIKEQENKPQGKSIEGLCQLCGEYSKHLIRTNDDVLVCRLCE